MTATGSSLTIGQTSIALASIVGAFVSGDTVVVGVGSAAERFTGASVAGATLTLPGGGLAAAHSGTVVITSSNGVCEGMQLHIPHAAKAADGSDGHLIVLDQIGTMEWDFYQADTPLASGGGLLTASFAGRTPINDMGGGTVPLWSQCTAGTCGSIGGIMRAPEMAAVLSGVLPMIEHALFGVVAHGSAAFAYPSLVTGLSGDSSGPACGQWLTLDLTDAAIDALTGIHAWHKGLLKTIGNYGIFVADQGSNGFIEFQSESHFTYDAIGAINPWIALAAAHASDTNSGITLNSGTSYNWSFAPITALESGAFWGNHLQVVDPASLPR